MQKRAKPYYGWYLAVTLAITETISWGIIYYAFTVFITPMESELGWTRTELTGAFSLALLVMGAMAFPVGTWIDRHGPRFLMTVGSILASLLILAWSQAQNLEQFYFIWIGLGVCGACVLYEPAFAVMASWFVLNRGRALAVITFAAGLASTIFIPLSNALLGMFGWRTAVLLLAIFLAVMTIPLHALVLRRRPGDLGLRPDGAQAVPSTLPGISLSQALRSRIFWLLTAAFSLAALAAAAIRVHFIPFLVGSGIDANSAALASGSIGLMQVAGRVIFAPLERRLSIRMLIIGIFAMQMISMTTLLLGTSAWVVGVFIIVFGTSYGAETLVRVTAVADQFGASHYGRISSVMALFLTAASTAAPVGAGLIYDRFGTYTPVLWGTALLALIAALLIFFAQFNAAKAAY